MIKTLERTPLTPAHADYLEIIQSKVTHLDPQIITGDGMPAEITYYCRQCKQVIEKPERIPKTLRFKCPTCERDRVAFGGRASVHNYYRLKEGRAIAKNLL